MLILSTFNSDYLQNPALEYPHTPLLESLFEKFTTEPINIKYVNKNLIGELLNLNLKEAKSFAILFRIFDFLEADATIDKNKLTKHLNLIVKQITVFKQESALPFLVFLCPSPEKVLNAKLKNIEKSFIEKLNENKIHTLTLPDIEENYRIVKFENPIEDDTHIPYTPEFYVAMAFLLARKLHVIMQKPYKAIAVDCDNTLWTGAAIDKGTKEIKFEEHNILLQKYLVKQHEKGVFICLCSRNANEKTILDVFNQRQDDMFLKLDHIAAYKINEKFKSQNIEELAFDLNLFPDSFRFIDDNPIEIYEVSKIPGVFCITMPKNLEEYKNHWAFDIDEHLVVTETDKNRAKLYRQIATKGELATRFHDPVEYLRSPELGQSIIVSKISSEDDMHTIQRISQLSGKTNQFNMFPESRGKEINEINAIANSDEREVFIGRIKDNFSPEDITSVAVSSLSRNNLIIDNFFVSCRVFRRGMEYEMLKHIAQFSQERGLKNIKLKFKKSGKNNSASDFLNILSEETNKDPISRFLLNKSRNYAWIHDSLKFLFKNLHLCLDFSSLELDEERILTLSVRKLIDLELDSLIRASLNVSHRAVKLQPNKLITDSNDINEKYLIELQQMTSSLDYLLSKFFIDNNGIKSVSELENELNKLCNGLLKEEGQDKSLVARGLDSLKATELRSYIFNISGIDIPLSIFRSGETTVSSLNEYIKTHKVVFEEEIKIVQNDSLYNQLGPASFQQERIWLAEQLESANNSANFHMFACYKVSKQIDIKHFELACKQIMWLYDAFGTSFSLKDGKLKQFVSKPEERELNFQVEELGERTLEEAIQDKISKPWTMQSKASLIHFVIFEDNNYHIFIHVHHAIFDAISLKNCLDSLSKLYEHSLVSIPEFNNPPQYQQFINYQYRKLADEAYQSAAYNFWKDALSKIETVTNLPNDLKVLSFKPAAKQTASRYRFSLSAEDLSNLKALAKTNGVTCFAAVNALFGLLVASYTYQKNITLITATNGRGGHFSFDKMVGFFVNILIQQFDLDKTMLFVEYLKQVNRKFLDSYEFQDIPFSKIQEILQDQEIKDILTSPALIYQNYSIPTLKLNEEIAELKLPEQPIIFDMRKTCRFGNFTLFAQENTQGLNFVIEYAKDLFSLSFIEAFGKNILHIFQNVCANPDQMLQEISVVCDEKREQLISLGQGPKLNFSEEITLVRKFQQNVDKYPKNTALCFGEICLNYKELDDQSTNLAHALTKAGVQSENYVGIFLDPNHTFFIAELAILKIGAIFIPLSKESPYKRLESIISDAKINFLIVDATRDLFDINFSACQFISINAINEFADVNKELPNFVKTTDTFCVLYTSGSTGTPKGVVLPEKGILRVVESPNFIQVSPGDKIAQTANQAFDAAQLECWLAWNHAASLVLFDKDTLLNINFFRKKLIGENITHMWLTAGLFNAHANYQPGLFESLRYLMVGGDVVDKNAVLKALNLKKHPIIINGYGPTEASIFALTHNFNIQIIDNYNTTLIGSPINETEVEILTPFGTKTPLGGIGELCIKGNGVGSYLNSPKLNQEKFTEDGGKRSYQTGDLVKYTTKNPEIMFIGRANDDQIKINGNLVALEEVRNYLSQHPAIQQVNVSIRNIHGTNQLVAFYILADKASIQPTKKKLNGYLSKFLDSYKFPSRYQKVDDFKLNSNGKIDTKQFRGIELEPNDNSEKVITAKTLYQKELLKIIRATLYKNSDDEKAREKSFPDNIKANILYFVVDSIKKMEIIYKINDEFKQKFLEKIYLTVTDLFTNPTIEELAELLTKKLNNKIEKKSLRELKKGDSDLPTIVFIHPAGGGLSYYDKLIHHVTSKNPCYGIEDPLLEGNLFEPLSMKQMAKNYLSIIAREVPGSFILAGYSFGGMLALEMACQYENTSENKFLLEVVLFDTREVSSATQEVKKELKDKVLIHCANQREKMNKDKNLSHLMLNLEKLCEHHQDKGFKHVINKTKEVPVFFIGAKNLNDTLFNKIPAKEDHIKIFEAEASHYDMLENPHENGVAGNFSKHIEETSSLIVAKKLSIFGSKNSLNFLKQPLVKIGNRQDLPEIAGTSKRFLRN